MTGADLLRLIDERIELARSAAVPVELVRGTVATVYASTRTAMVALDGGSTPVPVTYPMLADAPVEGDEVVVARRRDGWLHLLDILGRDAPEAEAGSGSLTDHTHAATGSGADGGGATLEPATLNATGTVRMSGAASVSLAANQDDWNPAGLSTASALRIDNSSGASRTVTGIVAQADGTILWVQNVGNQNIRFDNESASSTAANRILTYDTVQARLSPNASALLRYDGTLARWVLLAYPWNPAEDADISDLTWGDTASAAAPDDEFAPAGHVHGMPDNPVPTGVVLPYAGTAAPTGFLLCDGSAVSRTTYAALFAVCGTTYGAGDGSTTFNVPDTRQRFVLGKAASGTGATLGATGGAIDHDHDYTQVLQHTHSVTVTDPGHQHGMSEGTTDGAGNFADRSNAAAASAMTTDSAFTGISATTSNPAGSVATGTTTTENPPFLALNHIIKT